MTLEDARRIGVLGLGRSGIAAARALLQRGYDVTVVDAADTPAVAAAASSLAGARVVVGRSDVADVADRDLLIASPGVPPNAAWWDAGIPVWSEVELAYRLGARPLIAITGTNGKTTTTEMVAAILRADGRGAVAAGNIGTPLVDVIGSDAIVLEVSSFQLHAIEAFRAPYAVLLNIGADHLDWHGSMTAYKRAKMRIFENQLATDLAVVHADPECDGMAAGIPARVTRFHEAARPIGGAGIEEGWIMVPQGPVIDVERLRSTARPFRADAVAAAAVTVAAGVSVEVVAQALATFTPSPHRIETVAVIDGVTYINDSKATDPHATLAALEELQDVILIAGGRNKGLDLSELSELTYALRAVIAIGEAADEIVKAFSHTSLRVERAGSMEDAVEQARAIATAGDTVLLSPACASFDMFADYRERGDAFRAAVLGRGEDRG